MNYWAIMWITILGTDLDAETTAIAYQSLASCEAALSVVSGTLDYDHSISCEETDVPSSSIRPQPRPEGLTE
jgi:hypothetical protein